MLTKFLIFINNVRFVADAPKGFLRSETIRTLAVQHSLWYHGAEDDTIFMLTYESKLIPLTPEQLLWRDPLMDEYRFYTTVFLLDDKSTITTA